MIQAASRETVSVRINGKIVNKTVSELTRLGWTRCQGCHTWFPPEMKVAGRCEQCIVADGAWGQAAPGESGNPNNK